MHTCTTEIITSPKKQINLDSSAKVVKSGDEKELGE